jgi:hypothetical protein
MYISGKAELDEFIRLNKGKKGIIEVTTFEEDSTELQKSKFKNVIIPALIRGGEKFGDRYSERMMIEYVIRNCPGVEGEFEELSKPDLSLLIDWCIQFGAEQLGVIIH